MQIVRIEWLSERGGLHDARVLSISRIGRGIEIAFNDEWANERGLSIGDGAVPGTLILRDALLVHGDIGAAIGGWVGEVTIVGSNEFHLVFCNRDPLKVRVSTAIWNVD